MHQIFADLCPFESFCKLFAAYLFRGNSVQILFYNRYIFFYNRYIYGQDIDLFFFY